MDSEVTDLAGIKGVTISTLQVKPSEGAFENGDKTKLDGIEAGATGDQDISGKANHAAVTSSINTLSSSVASDVSANTVKLSGIESNATADQSQSDIEGLGIRTVGALEGGSITSGFGAIDNGTSGIRTNTFTAETSFVPDSNDGATLGTTSLSFSDLFLAEGGVINFDDGDVTVTQTGNVLAIDGTTGTTFAGHITASGNISGSSIITRDIFVRPKEDPGGKTFETDTDGRETVSYTHLTLPTTPYV